MNSFANQVKRSARNEFNNVGEKRLVKGKRTAEYIDEEGEYEYADTGKHEENDIDHEEAPCCSCRTGLAGPPGQPGIDGTDGILLLIKSFADFCFFRQNNEICVILIIICFVYFV